jgi:hypothetical protein
MIAEKDTFVTLLGRSSSSSHFFACVLIDIFSVSGHIDSNDIWPGQHNHVGYY